MASHNTLAVIERYEEYHHALNELISSIVTEIASLAPVNDPGVRNHAIRLYACLLMLLTIQLSTHKSH